MQRLWQRGRDARAFAGLKIAAIGPATAERLAAFQLRVDLVPPQYRAESLATSIVEQLPSTGRRVLLVRASRGREVLAEVLRAAGAEVDQVVAYRSTDVVAARPEFVEQMAEGKIDWVTVTSSAIARSLAAMFGPHLGRVKLASISPITTATLNELGYAAAAEASEFTLTGLVDAIVRAEQP